MHVSSLVLLGAEPVLVDTSAGRVPRRLDRAGVQPGRAPGRALDPALPRRPRPQRQPRRRPVDVPQRHARHERGRRPSGSPARPTSSTAEPRWIERRRDADARGPPAGGDQAARVRRPLDPRLPRHHRPASTGRATPSARRCPASSTRPTSCRPTSWRPARRPTRRSSAPGTPSSTGRSSAGGSTGSPTSSPTAIVGAHGPVLTGPAIGDALDRLRRLPDLAAAAPPTAPGLVEMLTATAAALTGASPSGVARTRA